MIGCPIEHGLYLKTFKVWNCNHFYISSLDSFPLSRYEISKVEDGHCLIAAQISPTIMGEEAIDLPLALELGTEALWVNRLCQSEWILLLRQIQILKAHVLVFLEIKIGFK